MRLLRDRIRAWIRRRHGIDLEPVILSARRIYILPSALGIAFAFMLLLMFLGAMNYANNLALGLTFLLGALGLTAMHHCHRNLAGLQVRTAASPPVFAGQHARFSIVVENTARLARHEIVIAKEHSGVTAARLAAGARMVLELQLPAPRRGLLKLEHFEILSRHPLGLFRAWALLHLDSDCIVYPRPAARGPRPPALERRAGDSQDDCHGEADFAGLRDFHPGDSPRHIAWKNYAKQQGLHVKQYAGAALRPQLFSWDDLADLDPEARLSQLCRWIEDAHAAGQAYGLQMPAVHIPPGLGTAHRQRCLTALALFETGALHG